MKFLLILLSAYVYAFDAGINVIRGDVVPDGAFPQVVRIFSGGASCTGTIVGKKVVISAAHCAKHLASVSFELDDKTYKGKAHHHPLYRSEDADVNLILLSEEVENINPIHISKDPVSVGDELTILGYGGTIPGSGAGGNDGILRMGVNKVTGRSGFDIVTKGNQSCAYGDSGGSNMYDNQLVALTSKGDIRSVCYVSELAREETIEFMEDWAQSNDVTICGISSGC